jgi:hypothetical protein
MVRRFLPFLCCVTIPLACGTGTDSSLLGASSGAPVVVEDAAAPIVDVTPPPEPPPDTNPGDAGVVDAGPPRSRQVVVCLTGAVDQNSGANVGFQTICNTLAARGLNVVKSGMYNTFATFPNLSASGIAEPAFKALDKNGDNKANALDGATDLNLIGFSWGGVNIESLGLALADDPRIDHAWLNFRFIALDGFQPNQSVINVPDAVDSAWSFRHSIASATDCSNGAPLGPYLGRRLACNPGHVCADYDFSLAPNATFVGLLGKDIGHCSVPRAASSYVYDLVLRGVISHALPPSVPVRP